MAISVDWITGEIFVPRFDMPLVQASPELRLLDVNEFRLTLRDKEDDLDGRPWPKTHRHDTETELSGVVYARKVEIIPPYFITFEAGLYAVLFTGANNNILDVTTVNGVSLRPNNSAGLQTVNVGGGVGTPAEVAAAVWNAATITYNGVGTFGEMLGRKVLTVAKFLGLR